METADMIGCLSVVLRYILKVHEMRIEKIPIEQHTLGKVYMNCKTLTCLTILRKY